jgi:hypothetical protein
MRDSSGLSNVAPGDAIQIRGHCFAVRGVCYSVPSDDIVSIGIMATEHEPLTNKTISRLYVDTHPFLLNICNGDEIKIKAAEIDHPL